MLFTKMHGLGNDYVVLGFRDDARDPFEAWSRALCDRYRGVGADGLLLVLPSETADLRMRIFNADGSEAEMCGNGVRCAAKFFIDTRHPEWKSGDARDLTVETLAGLRPVRARFENGEVAALTVNMGEPILEPARVPVDAPGDRAVRLPVEVDGKQLELTCVSMGNPHAVMFLDEDVSDLDIAPLGARLEKHPMFPRRTNVEFANVLGPAEIRMRVWERGVGETLACGTGACATLVAARLAGLAGRQAVLHLLGGDLDISWEPGGPVMMTGPAVTVFTGEWLGHL